DPRSSPDENQEQQNQQDRAAEAELLSDDGKDEIGVRLGEEEQFLPAIPDSETGQSSCPESDERLHRLEAAPERISLGMEESEDPGTPVLCAEHDGNERGNRGQR